MYKIEKQKKTFFSPKNCFHFWNTNFIIFIPVLSKNSNLFLFHPKGTSKFQRNSYSYHIYFLMQMLKEKMALKRLSVTMSVAQCEATFLRYLTVSTTTFLDHSVITFFENENFKKWINWKGKKIFHKKSFDKKWAIYLQKSCPYPISTKATVFVFSPSISTKTIFSFLEIIAKRHSVDFWFVKPFFPL